MGRSDGLDLVGRSAEVDKARGLLRRALDGPSSVLVVGGEAGIGKTRLAEQIAAEARALGFRVASGACLRMDAGPMPYAAIVGALRQLIREGEPATIAASLGRHRREIARLVPEVAGLATTAGAPAAGATPGRVAAVPSGSAESLVAAVAPGGEAPDILARMRLFEAVGGWLERLSATAPLLVVIEDLHWADPATLDLVRSLTLALATRSVLVVTLRTDEPPAAGLQGTIAELVRDGATRIELAPLDRAGIARIARSLGDGVTAGVDEEALDRLYEQSGGNPFLAVELVEAGLAAGGMPYAGVPPSLRDILDARLVSLDDGTLEVLRAAALHPGPIDDELLAAVLGRPLGRIGAALREAREAGVLAASAQGPQFRHALQREVLEEQLGPGERRMLHERFADALEQGGRDPSRATAIALHRDASGDEVRSLEAHVRAFEAADRASAFEAATSHAAAAAALWQRVMPDGSSVLPDAPWLLERASLDALLAGDPVSSGAYAREALALVGDDDARWATLHDRVRWALWEAGDRDGARREIERAVERLQGVPDSGPAADSRARLTSQQAAMAMDDADPARALALADEAIRAGRALGARDIEAMALGVQGRTLATHGRLDEGLASLRAALAIAEELGSLQGRLVGEAAIVTVLARGGRARDALTEIDAALGVAEASGLGRSLGAQLQADAARSCFAIGAWDDADRRIADGLARRPSAPVEASLRTVALRLAAARGREADGEALMARLAILEPALPDSEARAALEVARAEVALAAGQPAALRPIVDRVLGMLATGAERGSSVAWLGALAIQAEVDLALDARARADPAAEREATARVDTILGIAGEEAALAGAAWGPRATALISHVAAERSRLDPDTGRRASAWGAAVGAWEAIDRPYTAAYGRFRLAESQVANGGARAAVAEPLHVAASVLRSLHARPLLARVERLARLARVGLEPAGPSATTTPAGEPDALAGLDLTPREREVLRLVAAGWPNPRIAGHLGISVKTASVHVSNILGKLGVTNRIEAAALAHRLGVVGRDDGRSLE